jgi:hypothetical protein
MKEIFIYENINYINENKILNFKKLGKNNFKKEKNKV